MLESFIAQFYDDKPVPRLILLSHEVPSRQLLADALSTKAERRVEVRVPQRGTKTGVVEHALQNAREALGRKLAESSSQLTLLKGLQERFELPCVPRRIEVFDNSHIQGSNAVGAMIVAGASGFVKNQYRKFNIKAADLTPGDDYAMMREVLTRRFKRLVLDEAEAPTPRCRPSGDGAAEGEQRADPDREVGPWVRPEGSDTPSRIEAAAAAADRPPRRQRDRVRRAARGRARRECAAGGDRAGGA